MVKHNQKVNDGNKKRIEGVCSKVAFGLKVWWNGAAPLHFSSVWFRMKENGAAQ
jgi:hypothetical protein